MRVLHSRLRKTVIVTLKTGEAFRGVLYTYDRRALVLRNAAFVEEGGDRRPVPVDGEVLVLTADVAYLQVV